MIENPCFLMLFGMLKLDESAGFVRLIHALLSVSGSAGGSGISASPLVADTGVSRKRRYKNEPFPILRIYRKGSGFHFHAERVASSL